MVKKVFKISFYVPTSHLEQVKLALFNVGAGRYKNYDCCSWQTLGEGQFRPLNGSNPHFGQQGKIEVCSEYKVEMICSSELIDSAISALKQNHPYEEPAYEVYAIRI